MANSENQENLCIITNQRKRFLALLSPPTRYTPVSPYPKYTKNQLDMRRKVEILQYKKNSTQASQLNKSQRYSQIINASSRRGVICYNNESKLTPSSACDVPGPPCNFLLDKTVPLYNYIPDQHVYSEFTEPISTIKWDTHFTTGSIISTNRANTLLFTLTIQNIEKSQYTYDLNIPIGMYVSGISTQNHDVSGNIQINQATLNVYYYGSSLNNTYYTKTYYSTVIPHPSCMDVSCSFIASNTSPFIGTQYMGNLFFPGIVLPTEYGFVYDFKLSFILTNNTNSINSGYLTNFAYGVYMNFPQYDTSFNNCTIIPQKPPIFGNYLPFFINGS